MRHAARAICGLAVIAAVGPAHAVQCLKPGNTSVFHSQDNNSILFFVAHSEGDLTFTTPGQRFDHDKDAPPQKTEYFIEGVHYEFITTAASEFTKPGEAADPREILPRHAQSERAWGLKAGTVLKEFTVLDRTVRPAYANTHELYFLRWKLGMASDPYPHQLFMSTVIDGSVAMLTAIVTDAEQEVLAQASLDRFATSFRLIEDKEACPGAPQ